MGFHIDESSIEARIESGPDRMGLAIGLFEADEDPENGVRPVRFRLDSKLGELKGVSVFIDNLHRERGQTRRWTFTGTVSIRTREKSGYALSEEVNGFYDLTDRKGWIRFSRI